MLLRIESLGASILLNEGSYVDIAGAAMLSSQLMALNASASALWYWFFGCHASG